MERQSAYTVLTADKDAYPNEGCLDLLPSSCVLRAVFLLRLALRRGTLDHAARLSRRLLSRSRCSRRHRGLHRGGDLWSVSLSGGAAHRITSSPGMERAAVISPDGRTVAFSANYEGPSEVYTIPLADGLPQRRTWDAMLIPPAGLLMVASSFAPRVFHLAGSTASPLRSKESAGVRSSEHCL